MARRRQPGHPGSAGPRTLRHPGRNERRRGQRQGRLQDLAQDPDRRPRPHLPQVPAANPREHEGAGGDPHRRTGQDPAGCRGRRVPRPGGGRARRQHRQPAARRAGQQRRRRRRHLHPQPAAGRVRRHHPVQLPGDDPAVDVPDGHRHRQHLRPKALRAGPDGHHAPGRTGAAGRHPGGRAQRDPRRRRRGEPLVRPPGHQGGVLRRLHQGWHPRLQPCLAQRQARAVHDGRQEPRHRPARRPQAADPGQPGRLLFRRGRPALHGTVGGDPGRRGAGLAAGAGREGQDPQGQRRHRAGYRRRPGDLARRPGAHQRPDRPRRGGRRRAAARRPQPAGAGLRRRQLRRPDRVRRRARRHDHLPGRDLRPGALRDAGGDHGRSHRDHQRQPQRQRHGHLHPLRRRGPPLPGRDRRRPGRYQRADPGAGAAVLLHRLARLQARRPRPVRQAGGAVLHPDQDGHRTLVRRGRGRPRQHHHHPEVSRDGRRRARRPPRQEQQEEDSPCISAFSDSATWAPRWRATCSRPATG
ncbi:hypothetical protein OF001_U220054 [Pseudomonas sp. OF001]|nr:hypothetical protein OF001_U220054 [Pseudomonas sp. OF001]